MKITIRRKFFGINVIGHEKKCYLYVNSLSWEQEDTAHFGKLLNIME